MTHTLKGGTTLPAVGFGTYPLNGEEGVTALVSALEVGYRHIDTAKIYGNEEGVGQALAESDVARDEVFVTTKLWNDAHGRDRTLRAFDTSMDKLGMTALHTAALAAAPLSASRDVAVAVLLVLLLIWLLGK